VINKILKYEIYGKPVIENGQSQIGALKTLYERGL
tara:strand:- start:1960 stop:2064 length:105 start_codon:yes stop_codon:yes gene_type:complete